MGNGGWMASVDSGLREFGVGNSWEIKNFGRKRRVVNLQVGYFVNYRL